MGCQARPSSTSREDRCDGLLARGQVWIGLLFFSRATHSRGRPGSTARLARSAASSRSGSSGSSPETHVPSLGAGWPMEPWVSRIGGTSSSFDFRSSSLLGVSSLIASRYPEGVEGNPRYVLARYKQASRIAETTPRPHQHGISAHIRQGRPRDHADSRSPRGAGRFLPQICTLRTGAGLRGIFGAHVTPVAHQGNETGTRRCPFRSIPLSQLWTSRGRNLSAATSATGITCV